MNQQFLVVTLFVLVSGVVQASKLAPTEELKELKVSLAVQGTLLLKVATIARLISPLILFLVLVYQVSQFKIFFKRYRKK